MSLQDKSAQERAIEAANINQAAAVEAQSRIFENGLGQCVSFHGLLTGFQIASLFARIAALEKELAEARKPTRRERLIEQDKAIDATMQAGGGE